MESRILEVGQFYEGTKGDIYRVYSFGWHTQTNEEMIIFEDFFKHGFLIEPVELFLSKVQSGEENPNGQTYRYEVISKELIKQKMKSTR